MNNIIESIITIGILLVAQNSIASIYSQESNSSSLSIEQNNNINSFLDCYSTNAGNFMLANMFMPFTIDLTDPKIKKLISSMCKFYHEKTGVWVDISKDTEKMNPYTQEFWSQYPVNELPSDLLEFWKEEIYNK